MLIQQLRAGVPEAAEELWHRYFAQVVRLAQTRLRGAKCAAADEEDVALSAIYCLCDGARQGQFPHLADRKSLWALLVAITSHKAVDLIRRENRQKRGGAGADSANSAESQRDRIGEAVPLSGITGQQASPEVTALFGEQFGCLVRELDQAEDPDLLQIAVARMLGDSVVEIAARLSCARRTVERKIRLIRRIWEQRTEEAA